MTHGRSLATLLFALCAATANAKSFPAVPGQFIVKLKSTTSIMSTGNLEQALGATVKQQVSKSLGLILVQRPLVETSATSLNALAHNAMVEYSEPNYIYRVVGGAADAPTDPEFKNLWGMSNTGQDVTGDAGTFKAVPGMDIDAVRAWQVETGSKDVIVAVIDTGVNYMEPDLMENIFVNTVERDGKAGVDDDANGFVDDIHGYDFTGKDADPMDVYGHGTHVSGTIGARPNDGVGVVGVAWNVRILPVRFLGDDGGGTLADAVSSIEYAITMKANIMSNSWGGGGFSQALYDVINKAKAAGILFVAAAGNDGSNNDVTASYPSGYDLDNIVAVAAYDPTGTLASFSNYGKTKVHVAAPGVDIVSHTMKGLESWSGTSMATPHVSGIAALLLSQDMTQTYLVIKQRMIDSARMTGALRTRTQAGMVNAYYALTNQKSPEDPNDPFSWSKSADTAATDHPYANKTTKDFTFTVPGATKIAVYFSRFETESGYDKVTFKNAAGTVIGTLSGQLGEAYSPVIDGDTVTMTFTSDDSATFYGFDVGGIAYK